MGEDAAAGETPVRAQRRGLPRAIWALGVASLLMDTSSELIHAVLPLYMSTVLGASMGAIGLIEGVAEATAAITKVFSGAVSDRFGKRKPLMVFGYSLAAFTKPVFPLAGSIGWVAAARFTDRVGKGIRGAPRDALVADVTPREQRGAAYGLRQGLDSVGAFLGPALAIALMALLADDFRKVMWIAVAPAVACVVVLVAYIREPERHEAKERAPLRLADTRRLPGTYWYVVVLGAVFTLARFSEAFLILRAKDLGLPLVLVPAVMIVMNVVYSSLSYPAGRAADRVRPRNLLLVGLAALVAADVVFAAASSPWLALLGAALWGAHMAATQGLFAKLVADTAPAELCGSAFGVFNLVAGVALLLASSVAGALWSAYGASATFWVGAGLAAFTSLGVLAFRPPRKASPAD